MIKIDNFKSDYLEGHVRLGIQIVSKWIGGQQTPLDRLRKAYSGENFNPKEKVYAIDTEKNNKVVGFLTSSIKTDEDGNTYARMEFPVIHEDYDHIEIGDRMIKKILQYFKGKDVQKVISRASPAWGNTMDYVEKYNYQHDRILWKAGRLLPKDYETQSTTNNVIPVNPQEDKKQLIKILRDYRGMDEDKATSKVDHLSDITDRIISWQKITENGNIIAMSELVENKYDEVNAHMYTIFAEGENAEKYRDQIMDQHIKNSIEKNIRLVDNFFEPPLIDEAEKYEKYGFNINPISFYNKQL